MPKEVERKNRRGTEPKGGETLVDQLRFISSVANHLVRTKDFTYDPAARRSRLTDSGRSKVLAVAKQADYKTFNDEDLIVYTEMMLIASIAYINHRDYIVHEGELVFIDFYTGRLQPGRKLPDGIHQAIQAKEGLAISPLPLAESADHDNPVEALPKTDRLIDIHKQVESFFALLVPPPEIEEPPARVEDKRPEYLAALLATVPDAGGYAVQAQSLDDLSHTFRRGLAAQLQPVLNAHIQAMPHGSYEEKKALARWVNEELRQFDLAIKCPKTGRPGLLLGDPGNHPEIGRFCIEIKTEDGKKKRTVNTPQLPHLELMEAAPRREALSEWKERIGRDSGGARRS